MPYVQPPEHAVEVSVDIETLGKKPFCPILTIAAVRFEAGPMQAMEPFYQPVRLESCLDLGMKVDADTLNWWMGQPAEARTAAFDDEKAVDLPEALDRFTDWIGSRPDRLWGNSARFDMGILEAAYTVCRKQVPWNTWKEMDMRTLANLPGMDVVPRKKSKVAHHALEDAIAQAHYIRDMLMFMQKRQSSGFITAGDAVVPGGGAQIS